jgi:hypothetical protein
MNGYPENIIGEAMEIAAELDKVKVDSKKDSALLTSHKF